MSNCSTLTLCDPVTGAKVLVTNPGTADAAGFELPAGTPYAGDLAALVKCAAEGGGEAVDCEGNPLATNILTTATGLPNVDPACAPPLPACPIDGQITVDDKGITWQLIGGAWAPVAFTPACRLDRSVLGQIAVNDAQLAANGSTVEILGSVCASLTNDDCVPWEVSGRLRGFMLTQLSPGVRVIVSYVLDSASSNEIEFTDGTPTYTVDTRREDPGIQNDSEGTQIIGFESSDLLLPGETATACFNVTLRVQNYVSTGSNLLTLQSTIVTMKGCRALDI